MRKIALMATVLLALGACGGDGDGEGGEAFCDATRKVIDMGDVQELPPEVDTMVEEAPDEIRDSAETIRDLFREMFDQQDPSVIQTDEFREAAADVREYAVDNCEGVVDITQ